VQTFLALLNVSHAGTHASFWLHKFPRVQKWTKNIDDDIKNVSKIAHIFRWRHGKSIACDRMCSPRIVHPGVKTERRWASRLASGYHLSLYLSVFRQRKICFSARRQCQCIAVILHGHVSLVTVVTLKSWVLCWNRTEESGLLGCYAVSLADSFTLCQGSPCLCVRSQAGWCTWPWR